MVEKSDSLVCDNFRGCKTYGGNPLMLHSQLKKVGGLNECLIHCAVRLLQISVP